MKDSKTIIENFAEFASTTKFDDIPPRVIEKIKLQILNCLSAMKFSDWHPEAKKIYETESKKQSNAKDSTVIPLNEKLGAEEAAIVNAAYSMSLDFDDYMLMGHTGYSSVITPLAFLEAIDGKLGDLIVAATVTNEVMGRLSLSCFFGPLNGQMWSYIHNIGAATAVAKVKNFDAEKMANAMSLSIYQPNFCLVPGFWKEGCKLLTASIPLRTGIQAALYAENGLEGPLNIIEGDMGFLHFFSFHPVKEFMTNLGEAWLSDTLSYKRYPGTSYIGGPVDSALGAMKQLGLNSIENVDDIESIIIDTTTFSSSVEQIAMKQDYNDLDPIKINFSVRYSVAYALIRGDLLPKYYKQNEIDKNEDKIKELVKKIDVRHDIDMTAKTFLTFPQVVNVFKRMESFEMKRLRTHLKAVRASKSKFKDKLKTGIKFLKSAAGRTMIKKYIKKDKTPMNLNSVNLSEYPMLQSAKSKITLKNGKSAICYVPILTGGAGIDLEIRKKWVQKRFEMAFNKDPTKITNLLDNPKTSIREIIEECVS
jgi:2-methylcitrate dehydratase PrpD